MNRNSITDWAIAPLEKRLKELDFKPYNFSQILKWVYQRRVFVFGEMTDLSFRFRKVLEETFSFSLMRIADIRRSEDGTTLFLFELRDGRRIESVLIPTPKRNTLCLSTQVGCAMGCTFCRTGQMRLTRNLTQGEILEQVLLIQSSCPQEKITNIVFMGMGEPMANLSNLLSALEILTDGRAFRFAKRRITVSTAGIVPKMYEFIALSDAKLAISLHAPNDTLRSALMPINRRYPLKSLIQFCREYQKHSRHRITFEYALLRKINDSMELAGELRSLLKGIPAKINLIPFNPFPSSQYEPSEEATVTLWKKYFFHSGIQTNVRSNRGRDILAACGQLAA